MPLRTSPGAILPADMNERQWSEYVGNQRVVSMSLGSALVWDGQTLVIDGAVSAVTGTIGGWTLAATYLQSGSGATTVRLDSGGTNPAISAGSATPASAPFRVTQAGALTATNATITGTINANAGAFVGGVTIGTAGSMSSGQSAYDTGTGFWIEYNAGTPRLSIGNASGNKLTWNGTALSLVGEMTLTNSAQTFAPTWVGFSTDPTGNFSYIDFGAYVILFSGVTATGYSNAVTMSISNLPSGIRPSDARTAATVVVDDGSTEAGFANIATDGNVYFFRNDAVNFTTSDTAKQWPSGATLIYAK